MLRKIFEVVFEYTKVRAQVDPHFKQMVPGALQRILRFNPHRLSDQSRKILWAALNDSEDYRCAISDFLNPVPQIPPGGAAGDEASQEDRPGAPEADTTGAGDRAPPPAEPSTGDPAAADADSDPALPHLAELIWDPGMLFIMRPEGWLVAYQLHRESAELSGDNERLREGIRELEAAANKNADDTLPPASDPKTDQTLGELTDKLQDAARRNRDLQKELRAEKGRCQQLEAQVKESSRRCDKAEKDLKKAERAARNARDTWNAEREALQAANTDLQQQNIDLQDATSQKVDVSDLQTVFEEFQSGLTGLQADLIENLLGLGPDAPLPADPVPGDGTDGAAPIETRPLDLPQGLEPDAFEAADHLCGLEHSCLVVDGYNVTMKRWDTTEVDIAEQRARLDLELVDFCARRRNRALIVWDGVDPDTPPQTGRDNGVQHKFSAGDGNADDLIIETIPTIPLTEVLVVVTSDRELRRRAVSEGANVIGADRLWEVLEVHQQGGTE